MRLYCLCFCVCVCLCMQAIRERNRSSPPFPPLFKLLCLGVGRCIVCVCVCETIPLTLCNFFKRLLTTDELQLVDSYVDVFYKYTPAAFTETSSMTYLRLRSQLERIVACEFVSRCYGVFILWAVYTCLEGPLHTIRRKVVRWGQGGALRLRNLHAD